MNKILGLVLVLIGAGAGVWYLNHQKHNENPTLQPPAVSETKPEVSTEAKSDPKSVPKSEMKASSTSGDLAPGKLNEKPNVSISASTANTADNSEGVEKDHTHLNGNGETTKFPETISTPTASLPKKETKKADVKDGVDGNIAQPGDDGEMPPNMAAPKVETLAGVKTPIVWLVASDLKSYPSGLEIGTVEGKKATPWKNRSGNKLGDGVRIRGAGGGTFNRTLNALALCAPNAKDCVNIQPTQLKMGLDVNHKDHWLAGPDKAMKSAHGGSSFTVLFVATRASANANPLLEHQNGESAGSKGVFLGWVGPDLVGSIHGLQGVVGVNAVSTPNPYVTGSGPQITTLRFDRKKAELKLFLVNEKKSEGVVLPLRKDDAPDNDQYAGIAMGSKNPGAGAITYVYESAAYSRALDDKELCAIHKEWNEKYGLKIPAGKLKPCSN